MRILIALIFTFTSTQVFALKKCTVWKVDRDAQYTKNGNNYISNYFRKHDTANRGQTINQDPKRKKIKRGQGFGTCKKIAKRLIGVLCNTNFTTNTGYTGNYGLGSSSLVPSQTVKVDRLHFGVLKDLSINGTNIINNNRNQGYINCN